MGLDPVLVALASCPVVEQKEEGGHIVFNPYPVITASNDLILAHEICHRISGSVSYNKFVTACHVRKSEPFKFVLNVLLDWWDELTNSQYSIYLHKRITQLKEATELQLSYKLPKRILSLFELYKYGTKPSDFPRTIQGIEDLIVYADKFIEESSEEELRILAQMGEGKGEFVITIYISEALAEELGLDKGGRKGSPAGMDINNPKVSSNFYAKTISKYHNIIETVATLWKRNKYDWKQSYFGEINWKNLPALFMGEEMGLPVYRLLKKLTIARNIYIIADRSGSTRQIRNEIMETVIIITESFRRSRVAVSILDVGHTNSVINKIDEPIDTSWFTPLSDGGTPLGDVINKITEESQMEDYLLIVTDGEPDSWDKLKASLAAFKGDHLTFVIGDSFKYYYQQLGGRAVSVEPTTIVRELMNNNDIN